MFDPLGGDADRIRAAGVAADAVSRAALAVAGSLRAGGKLLVFGNGGSAADAQHVAAELVGRFERDRRGLPALALTTDTSAMTAIANDMGFENVFARQIEALAVDGDVVLAISTSGRSANVLRAVEGARRRGVTTVGLCGAPGCQLCEAVHIPIAAPAGPTAAVQEVHLLVEHAICRAVERLLFEADPLDQTVRPGSVVHLGQLLPLRAGWAAGGRTVVWTNGCFDTLHAGHLASLTAARALGDILVVGVNSDDAVTRLKGEGRPLMKVEDRAVLLAALRPVDYVVVFEEDTPEQVLGQLRPDIHCKGAEYSGPDGKPIPERQLVEGYGGRVEFLPVIPGRSSSDLIRAIRDEVS